ncbi:MAG: hypothetical protein ACKO1F_10915 [Flammeovirgaceae bacterium]
MVFTFFANRSIGNAACAKPKKIKKGGTVKLQDSLTTFSQSDLFDFPNINKVRLYSDAGKLKQLQQNEKSGNEAEMYRLLRTYVKNFGIENFAKNVPLLWRLAQLSEKLGPKGEAVLLYKLLLKHRQQGININDLYKRYESVETEKKENYVPLDLYYKLVGLQKRN